jgi:adenylyltransferase/sulfurtransferase
MPYQELTIEQSHDLYRKDKDLVVLDVRTPMEYTGPCGHIKDSILIPIDELPLRWRELEPMKERPILAICYVGQRSRMACQFLQRLGFAKLFNAPGMMEWHDHQYEVVPGEPTPEMPEC